MKFLCGCDMPSKERLQGDPELTSLDTVEFDTEGFVICSVHRTRRYGWRVPNHRPLPLGVAGCSEIEYERYMLLGIMPHSLPDFPETKEIKATEEDRRDNRDPVEDADSIMASVIIDRSKHKTNGTDHGLWSNPGGGRALMEYQRRVAQSNAPHKTESGKISLS